MKRSNGAGCVTKLSGNRRTPWMARITDGWDEVYKEIGGKLVKVKKQRYKLIGYFETKAEAEIAISLYSVMPISDDANITLLELYEQWKTTRHYIEISRQARDCYDAGFKYLSKFYKIKFKDMRTRHFQAAVDLAESQGKSRSTMEKIKTIGGILSEYAFSQDIVNKVYYKSVRLPSATKKQIGTFTDIEKQVLIKNDTDEIVMTVLIFIYTGMRITELLKLSKWYVDIKNWLITGGVKTEAGKDRIIPIHTKIRPYILYFYEKSERYLIEYDKEIGSAHKKTKRWVRRRYTEKYYREDFFYPALERLGINEPGIHRLTPHKARHTFFTRLTEVSRDRKANAEVGGHADPAFTEKTYVQPDVERLRRAIEKM